MNEQNPNYNSTPPSQAAKPQLGSRAMQAIRSVKQNQQPVKHTGSSGAIQGRPPGFIQRLIADAAERQHFKAMTEIRNTVIEAQAAMDGASIIANDLVENGLETAQGMEESVKRHEDSELAMDYAPLLLEIGTTIFTETAQDIARAGTNRTKRVVERR